MPTKIEWVKNPDGTQGEYCGECPEKDKDCDSYCIKYKRYTTAEIDNGELKFRKCLEGIKHMGK